MLVPLVTSGCTVTLNNFWNAIFLYHDRPHVVNRKLTAFTQAYLYEIDFNGSSNKLKELLNYIAVTYETNRIKELTKETLKELIPSLLKPYDKNLRLNEVTLAYVKEKLTGKFISLRILYPSNPKSSNCVEIVLIDKDTNSVTFVAGSSKDKFTLVAPPFPYCIEFANTGHVRVVVDVEDADSSSAEWLDEKLFPKLIKWAEEYDESLVNPSSLSLVYADEYCGLYKELKEKYGQKMIKIWPENTDPLKFVYEDVAIATYLICLWKKTSPDSKPSFVDLGCGNGLLVYILAEEGFPGVGIDVRSRKIWSLYPKHIQLQELTIVPSESSLFPNSDWIIGNHSDELTPWIPVIAARSSPKTNFFVLPCCSYDFNGRKYIRKNTNLSLYNEYLDYIKTVSVSCGFNVAVDKLRIPSTKRTCLVSFGRNHEDFNKVDSKITEMINERCGGGEENCWVKDFQAREVVEKVRNCTQLDKGFIKKIVGQVVAELLKQPNYLVKSDKSRWNCGGTLLLSELIKCLDCEDLKVLKKECGGLQTLLKNHRYVFEVVKGGVKLRVPLRFEEVAKYKEKPCWFLQNHPDGCLHKDDCAYGHF